MLFRSKFYSSGEQAGARPDDAFDLVADSPIFGDNAEFVVWNPKTTDETSPLLKAIRHYQALLKFHANDDDKSAWLDADLGRLTLGHNHATGEEKSDRYQAALKRFVDKWGDFEISAEARYLWANELLQADEPAEARELALAGTRAFPNSPGGDRCRFLVEQIEYPHCQINTERVWNQPWPGIRVEYRNLTSVSFRLYKVDWESRLNAMRFRPEQFDHEFRPMVAKKADHEWTANLPPAADYRIRHEMVATPADVKPGFYFLIASQKANFEEANNQLMVTDVWVSTLALVMNQRQGDEQISGFVLDASSGDQIGRAHV